MKKYSAPITEENFDSAAAIILKHSRICAAGNRASNIVVPVGTALYVFLSLIFTYGIFYSLSSAEDAIVFEKLGFITAIWEFFAKLLMVEGAAWYINAAIFVLALLLIPMIISMIISLIFLFTSKEITIAPEAVTAKDKGKSLYETISNLPENLDADYGIMGLVCAGVYIALVIAFMIYGFVLTFSEEMLYNLFYIVIGVIFAAIIVYFAYTYLFMLSGYMNACLCSKRFNYKFKTDVYNFWCENDPEESERNQKEKEAKSNTTSGTSMGLFTDTAYYKERKEETMRNIDKYVYGYSYPDYTLTGVRLDDRAALVQYLNSNAPDSVKAAAIKKYNDYHLDNFHG